MSDDRIEVAPREVNDLVHDCCRVLGLDGGIAEDVARSVTSIEVHYGRGLVAFDHELTRLLADGDDPTASAFVRAPAAWRRAEAEMAAGGPGRVELVPPAPLAALGAVLDDSLARGIACPALDAGPGSPTSTRTGLDPIAAVELLASDPADPAEPPYRRARRSRSLRQGLRLPGELVGRLQAVAARFLVAEAVVDAARP